VAPLRPLPLFLVFYYYIFNRVNLYRQTDRRRPPLRMSFLSRPFLEHRRTEDIGQTLLVLLDSRHARCRSH